MPLLQASLEVGFHQGFGVDLRLAAGRQVHQTAGHSVAREVDELGTAEIMDGVFAGSTVNDPFGLLVLGAVLAVGFLHHVLEAEFDGVVLDGIHDVDRPLEIGVPCGVKHATVDGAVEGGLLPGAVAEQATHDRQPGAPSLVCGSP